MPHANLTDIVVKNLKPMGYATLWDTQLRGFGIRRGLASKTWVVMVGKQRKRITVGRYPGMSLKEARSRARIIMSKPHHDSPTLFEVIDRYSQVHLYPNTKPTTAKETTRMLHKNFDVIGHRKIADISIQDINAITDALQKTPTEGNMAFTHLRSLLNWAVSKRIIILSPLVGAKLPYKRAKRDKTLTLREMSLIFQSSEATFGTIVNFCILTAQRRTQIGSLEWSWINHDRIIFPSRIMKGGTEHILPLTDTVRTVLGSIPRTGTYVFPTRSGRAYDDWARDKRKLDAACDLTGWVLHDLRRSAATMMASQGTSPHIIERILAHTGSQSDVALTYNRYQYLPEMRHALERHETILLQQIAGTAVMPSGATLFATEQSSKLRIVPSCSAHAHFS